MFDDAAFAAARFDIDADQVLAVSPDMKRYLREVIEPDSSGYGPLYGLVRSLYATDHLRLDYDSAVTRTAAQTFAAREANCLSLVLMTAAFASELNLDVQFQRVLSEDVAVADGDLIRLVGHVNIGLSRKGAARVQDRITVDFLAPEDARRLHSEPISVERVKAMYLNNRAVESLSDGHLGSAYWWAKASVQQDPGFASPLITLGAIWERAGRQVLARNALAMALRLDPDNPSGLSNLALTGRGKAGSASLRNARSIGASSIVSSNTLTPTVLKLLKTGDYEGAMHALEGLIHDDDRAENHLLLGAVYSRLGHATQAADQMAAAARASAKVLDQAHFNAKAAALRRTAESSTQ